MPMIGDVMVKRNQVGHKHNVNQFLEYVVAKRTAQAQLEEMSRHLNQNLLVDFKRNFPKQDVFELYQKLLALN